MQKNLAEKLIARGVINSSTEICAEYDAPGIGGMHWVRAKGVFLISNINNTGDDILVDMTSIRDGSRCTLPVSRIVEIDGMDPVRFASVYNVRPDGADQKLGKRRGRRPKVR